MSQKSVPQMAKPSAERLLRWQLCEVRPPLHG